MRYRKICFRQFGNALSMVALACLILIGCDNSTSTEEPVPQITDALIQLDGASDEATIEAGETVRFTAYALTESGDQIPIDELNENWSWEWQSTDTAVFTVDTEGNGTGEGEGDAFCVITLTGPDGSTESSSLLKTPPSLTTASNPGLPGIAAIFVGRDSLFVSVAGSF